MAINPDELVARIRALLTQEDAAIKFPEENIYAAIPAFLAEWRDRNQNRPDVLATIVAETEEIDIIDGLPAPLAALSMASPLTELNAAGIDLSEWKKWIFYITHSTAVPQLSARPANSRDRLLLNGIQDGKFLLFFFDGIDIFFKQPGTHTLTGAIKIRGQAIAKSLDVMPVSAIGDLIIIGAEIMRKMNTDGEHKGAARRLAQK